uniref:Uncharacterized protein n=1 Tax=Arundo donax TaxID=35708 RepID=A0A0A9BHA7_ARUDO
MHFSMPLNPYASTCDIYPV